MGIKKLKSNSGASLMIALLLFLVCTVVGVIVLVAGTAASGRMSELAKADARYYAVQSAAQLLLEEIEGEAVEAARFREQTVTITTYAYTDASGEPRTMRSVSAPETTYPETEFKVSCLTPRDAPLPFLTQAAEAYVIRGESDAETIWAQEASVAVPAAYVGNSSAFTGGSVTVTRDDGTPVAAEVAVGVEMDRNGRLLVTLSYDGYSLVMTFAPALGDHREEIETPPAQNVASPPEGSTSIHSRDSEEEYISTKTDTVTWKLKEIR